MLRIANSVEQIHAYPMFGMEKEISFDMYVDKFS